MSRATGEKAWETVIGVEVHCQLGTRTKLFCGCRNEFGAAPNANTCPICTGQPGVLPVLNRRALLLGVRAALALGADVAAESRFDRKNYFYCDLPKGYQITQYALPFATGGGIELASGRRIRLARIHLEEDAGKAIHDRGATTLVDLNRAGVPLIEAVSEADLRSAAEAHEYLTAFREILRYAGVSDCDMEKGSLRCDVNVSVHPPGEPWRTKVELKNLNSFRHVADAIEHEIARQTAVYEGGGAVAQETRLFDARTGTTHSMRSKEDEDDYRYFPEPDLPPAIADAELVEEARAGLTELPAARRQRYAGLGLSEYDAGVLTGSREVADFFDATCALCDDPKAVANWIANDVLAALGDDEVPGGTIDALALTPRALAELVGLVAGGTLHPSGARRLLRELLVRGGEPRALARELDLEQVRDEERIEAWCRAALAGNERAAAEVRAGKEKALGALVGPVMKASGGKANPALVREALLRLLREDPEESGGGSASA